MEEVRVRLKELLSAFNISQADMVRKTGIPKSCMSTYFSGKRLPKQSAIDKISRAYRINPAWIMGYDVPMSLPAPSQQELDAELDARLLTLIHSLNADDRKIILSIIERLSNTDTQ